MYTTNLSDRICPLVLRVVFRNGANPTTKISHRHASMLAWKVHDSLNNSNQATVRDKLKLECVKMPTISSPSEVLVKIHATSINPLDYKMIYGYGRPILDMMDWSLNSEVRITNDRYPLTLGRDFSGEVIAKGPYAEHEIGDLVFGAIEPHRSGAHSQYVIADSRCLEKKPDNLSHNQAASIPFTALTAYSALCCFGNLSRKNCQGKQVLVIGGSGGVGSFAIQLLKLWGANVTSTCSEVNTEWLETTLFVDKALNYNDCDELNSLEGRFDFVLDCGSYDKTTLTHQEVVESNLRYLKRFNHGIYVTLSPPFLNRIDQNGLVIGTVQAALDAASDTFKGLVSLNSARWAFFMPNKAALNYISNLFKDEAIMPQVGSVFKFDRIPEAYEQLRNGHNKGKVVVEVS